MGAVHGVYLKYVGMSALSYAGYAYLIGNGGDSSTESGRNLLIRERDSFQHLIRVGAGILKYSAIVNGTIAILFKMERGMDLVGKDPKRGTIPFWSYIIFFPFHIPTIVYTHIHTKISTHTMKDYSTGNSEKESVPVATEVQPGWWVGGCYSNELKKKWAGIIDLTVEFPESCINHTEDYLLVSCWDGVPPDIARLEEAANFAHRARKKGHVLVHCAHGRGRSTTVMCAALVRAGLYQTWQEAFEKGIKPARPVCKLNRRMRDTLTEWQNEYGKKA